MANESAAAVVRAYHDRTKHGFRRFAASLGYLDWATQPEAFRWFDGADVVRLPFEVADGALAYEGLYRQNAREPSPLTAEAVSDLLYHSLAVSAWKQAGSSRWALRVNPSSGNLHPTEGYLVLPAVEGLTAAPGVHHYLPRDHVLETRATLDEATWNALTAGLPPGSFLVGLSSIHWREAWKYGERAFRYCQHDVGHSIAALRLAAAIRGWSMRLLTSWSADAAGTMLGVDREGDFSAEEEREEVDVLAVMSPVPADPAPPSEELLVRIRGADWRGEANVLSRDHVEWTAIDEVAAASREPGGCPAEDADDRHPIDAGLLARSRPADARPIIRTRRSGVAFDPGRSIPRDAFLRILDRTLPRATAPFDALTWSPRVHLLLFVHRVDEIEPGLYLLVRRPLAEATLRAAARDDFLWVRPEGVPDGFPLFRLMTGDVRDVAAQLSCGQDIAGDAFFSLGMLAELGEAIRTRGPSAYRQLFWEAGAIGQVLYLEAEAEGVRGTGIGCYFDDPVHDLLGLEDREIQSLYHFTIGVAVEDHRLTTLPAYPNNR